MAVYKTENFKIARKIVSNMTTESWNDIPHATMSYEADVTELLTECKKLNSISEEKITINTLMLKIICEGLKAAPKMNCTLDFNKKLVTATLPESSIPSTLYISITFSDVILFVK